MIGHNIAQIPNAKFWQIDFFSEKNGKKTQSVEETRLSVSASRDRVYLFTYITNFILESSIPDWNSDPKTLLLI